jgi:hypothetical protein
VRKRISEPEWVPLYAFVVVVVELARKASETLGPFLLVGAPTTFVSVCSLRDSS